MPTIGSSKDMVTRQNPCNSLNLESPLTCPQVHGAQDTVVAHDTWNPLQHLRHGIPKTLASQTEAPKMGAELNCLVLLLACWQSLSMLAGDLDGSKNLSCTPPLLLQKYILTEREGRPLSTATTKNSVLTKKSTTPLANLLQCLIDQLLTF